MQKPFGASPEEWDHLSFILGLTEDLLPVVSDPAVPISPDSTLKATGKTPSTISRAGAAGIAQWTQKRTTQAEVERWRSDARLGICIQTREVRAFDIDIDNPELAQKVAEWVTSKFALPCRTRANSPKRLFAFRLEGELPKRVIKMQTGMVEMLGTGQQFIACGTHPSGTRYEWVGGLPDEIPILTKEQFENIWSGLATTFGISQSEASTPTKAKVLKEAIGGDSTAQHLIAEGFVKQQTKEGALHIRCPFESGHSVDSADSATTYWPAHTGGYTQGHFHCLHASCAHRTDDDFRVEIGMPMEDLFEGFYPMAEEEDIRDSRIEKESPSIIDRPEVKKQRFHVVPAHEFADRKPPGWIIKGVLPKADLAVIYGDSGSGKSFLAIDLCAAIARGVDWRGHRVQRGKVAYICAEGAGGMRARLRAYSSHHRENLGDIDLGIIPEAPNFMQVQDIKDLILSVQAFGKTLVIVVDTFAQVMSGANENAGEDVGKALEHCRQLHKYTGALVILIHHSGKDASKGARGWSGLRAAADAEIEIVRCDDDRVATITKMKDGQDGAEFGFKLTPLILGLDDDGDEITSCVVEEASTKREAVAHHTKAGTHDHLVLRCLDANENIGDNGVPSEDLVNAVVAQLVPSGGLKDTRRPKAVKAIESLVDKGVLVFVNGFVKRVTKED